MRPFDIKKPYNSLVAHKLNTLTLDAFNKGSMASFLFVMLLFFSLAAIFVQYDFLNIDTTSTVTILRTSLDLILSISLIASLFVLHERLFTPLITRHILKRTLKHTPDNIDDYIFTTPEKSLKIKKALAACPSTPARDYILQMNTNRPFLNVEYTALSAYLSGE